MLTIAGINLFVETLAISGIKVTPKTIFEKAITSPQVIRRYLK